MVVSYLNESFKNSFFDCCLLSQSAQAAITKHSKTGWFKQQSFLSQFWKLSNRGQGDGHLGSFWEPSSWLAESSLLCVLMWQREREREREDAYHLEIPPFGPSHLSKSPHQITSYVDSGLSQWIMRGHTHSVRNTCTYRNTTGFYVLTLSPITLGLIPFYF